MNQPEPDELDVYMQLFEAGKELSRQYAKYNGDKDWTEWLAETIPKTTIPGVPNSGIASILAAYTHKQTEQAVLDAQIDQITEDMAIDYESMRINRDELKRLKERRP